MFLIPLLAAALLAQAPKAATPPGQIFRVGGGVSAPEPLYAVVPQYSREALAARYQGTVTLSIVVEPSGAVRDVRVIRALGLGLDQKAADAAGQAIYFPAKKDGQPVPVVFQTQITFRLSDAEQAKAGEGLELCGARADLTSLEPVQALAEQGNPQAQQAIGCLAFQGEAVQKDLVQAHLWLSLAAQGLPRAVAARDAVAKKMTPEEIAKAQALLREWKPRTP